MPLMSELSPEILAQLRQLPATPVESLLARWQASRREVTVPARDGALLIRVAENATGRTWNRVRAELQRQHAVTWTGPAGTFRQTTDLTKPLRDIYTALAIEPPKKILALDPAPPAS